MRPTSTHAFRVRVLCALTGALLTLAWTDSSLAQPGGLSLDATAVADDTDPGAPSSAAQADLAATAETGNPDGQVVSPLGFPVLRPFGPLARLNIHSGSQPGYNNNYVSGRVFVPIHTDPGKHMMFWVLNGGTDDEDDFFFNLGIGGRHYSAGWDSIIGGSFWFETDQRIGRYWRIGTSIEGISKYFESRLNTYLIVFGNNEAISQAFTGGARFQGNNILLTRRVVNEEAYSGADWEGGGRLPFLGRYGFSAYAGFYYHRAESDAYLGVQARLLAHITEHVDLNVRYNDDDTNGTTVGVNVAFTFPNHIIPKSVFRGKEVVDRMSDPVQRHYRIPTRILTTDFEELALAKNDNAPIVVMHVDPDDTQADGLVVPGAGTFENPLNSLDAARIRNNANVDIVYINPRDDGSSTNLNLNGTFFIQSDQSILSTSKPHQFCSVQGNNFFLPGFAGVGPNPQILGPGGAANTFSIVGGAQNVVIGGIDVDGNGSTGAGLFANGVNNLTITCSNFSNSATGALLFNVSGTANIGIDNNGNLGANTFSNNFQDGFVIENIGAAPLVLNLTGNTANDNGPVTGFGFDIVADGSTINATVTNNTATGNGTGFRGRATNSGTFTATFTGNNFSNNNAPNSGLRFEAVEDAGGLSFIDITSFRNNVLNDNNGNGAVFFSDSDLGVARIDVTDIANNQFNNNGAAGLLMQADGVGGGTAIINANVHGANLTADRNTFDGNTNGVEIQNNRGAVTTVIRNADVTNNTGFGVFVNNTSGLLDLTIGGPTAADLVAGTPGDGVNFTANGTGTQIIVTDPDLGAADPVDILIQGNTYTDQQNSGIVLFGGDGVDPVNNWTINNNTITGSGDLAGGFPGVGMSITGAGDAIFTVDATNNLIDNTDGGNGVVFNALDITEFTVNMADTTIQGSVGDGVEYNAEAGSNPTVNIDRTTITGSGENGIEGNFEGATTANLFVGLAGAANINQNTGFGVLLNQGLGDPENNTADPTVEIRNSQINNNAGGGISWNASASVTAGSGVFGQGSVTIDSNIISTNGANAILYNALGQMGERNGGFDPVRLIISNNNISGHTGTSIELTTDLDYHQQVQIDIDDNNVGFIDPNDAGFAAQHPGFYRAPYLNLLSLNNLHATITGNRISGSDVGVDLIVGTGTYQAVEISGNVFSGNTTADFQSSSFLSAGDTNASVDNAAPADDNIFLEDTAQVNLQFFNNTGSFVAPDANGARYTNADTLKDFDPGFTVTDRPAFLFLVQDTTPADLGSSNAFIDGFGVAQDVRAAFLAGQYFIDDVGFPLNTTYDPAQGGPLTGIPGEQ